MLYLKNFTASKIFLYQTQPFFSRQTQTFKIDVTFKIEIKLLKLRFKIDASKFIHFKLFPFNLLNSDADINYICNNIM